MRIKHGILITSFRSAKLFTHLQKNIRNLADSNGQRSLKKGTIQIQNNCEMVGSNKIEFKNAKNSWHSYKSIFGTSS